MPKYELPDDGTVVDGKIVVYLPQAHPPGPDGAAGSRSDAAPGADDADAAAARAELARLQAAALTSAAAKGVPFCAECEQARRDLAKDGGSPQ
jgi:hypothetical protein